MPQTRLQSLVNISKPKNLPSPSPALSKQQGSVVRKTAPCANLHRAEWLCRCRPSLSLFAAWDNPLSMARPSAAGCSLNAGANGAKR